MNMHLLWRLHRAAKIVLPVAVLVDFAHSCFYVSQLYQQRLQEWQAEEHQHASAVCLSVLERVFRTCATRDAELWPLPPSVHTLRSSAVLHSPRAQPVLTSAYGDWPVGFGTARGPSAASQQEACTVGAAAAAAATPGGCEQEQQRLRRWQEQQQGNVVVFEQRQQEEDEEERALWSDILLDLADTLWLEDLAAPHPWEPAAAVATAASQHPAGAARPPAPAAPQQQQHKQQQRLPVAAHSPAHSTPPGAAASDSAASPTSSSSGSNKGRGPCPATVAASLSSPRKAEESAEGGGGEEPMPSSLYWLALQWVLDRYDVHPWRALAAARHRQWARLEAVALEAERRLKGTAAARRLPHVVVGRRSALRFRWQVLSHHHHRHSWPHHAAQDEGWQGGGEVRGQVEERAGGGGALRQHGCMPAPVAACEVVLSD